MITKKYKSENLIYIIYVLLVILLMVYFSFKIYDMKHPTYELLSIRNLPHEDPGFRDTRAYNCSLKPNNTFRIIALGDSFTWGGGVNAEENYPTILEQLLNENSSRIHYEVINFGIPGHTMTQKVEEFKEHAIFYITGTFWT